MQAELQSQVAFYLTGRTSAESLDAVGGLGLRPALLAGYRNLATLRYDFPLILSQKPGSALFEPLTGAVDAALAKLAEAGKAGDRVAKQAVRVESEIRAMVAAGTQGTFSSLWDQAVSRLGSRGITGLADNVKPVRAAIAADGQLLDCSEATPGALLRHCWTRVQEDRASRLRDDVARLLLKLSEILSAEFAHSEAGLSAQNLKASVGNTYAEAIDFQAMSRLLLKTSKRSLSKSRRDRIRGLIATLKGHRFAPSKAMLAGDGEPYSFVFQSCGQALKAYRERLPKLVELAKALAVAQLEIDGEYSEDRHDALFEGFSAATLEAKDLARFPDYLVCAKADALDAADSAKLMEILSSGLPMKVMVQSDDILEPSPFGGRINVAALSRQIVSTAMALNDVYVLQSSASHLAQYRERIAAGLAFAGPSLFSVYSGAAASAAEVPPYLNAAAAMESRAFPAFVYDPSAGVDWASRFSLEGNSQPEADWPVRALQYEDEALQSQTEQVSFTLIDFFSCDARFASHFARVPKAKWNGSLLPLRDCLSSTPSGMPDKVPYLNMVDADNRLQKVIVDDQLVREARRCASLWHGLQELGGIGNSHAVRLLQAEKSTWEEKLRAAEAAAAKVAAATPAAAPVAASAASAAAPAAAAPAEAEAEKAPSADEAYIETPRCTTCEECVRLNGKMFVYDGNKQAYIKDIKAGTYRQLVEAAENCQVSIIHPGKPINPSEPGLDELVKRAELFQ